MRPFVSVVMPVRNEAGFITRSLGSVLAQSYPHDRMEVIIADGMSIDATRDLIPELSRTSDIPVRIVDNPKGIAPAGLNLAVAASNGDIIVRVDGHCEIAPDYVESCVELLSSGKADGVGGPIDTIGETTTAIAIALAMSSKFGVGGSAFRTVDKREIYTDTVAFPGYTRQILERMGPFNEELVRNQDDEFNYRIRKAGGRILLSPKIRSKYYSRGTFRSLWRQYYQYGYWKVRVLQLHPRQMSVRQFVPVAFVSVSVLLAVAALLVPGGIIALIAFAGVYLMANMFSAVTVARSDLRLAPHVAYAFLILHISYGTGFAAGLFTFASRWRQPNSGLVAENP
jgi:succinoglycan biosynthesis protein ExoA